MTALDKKEALLVQLRNMNEEAAAGMHSQGDAPSSDYTPGFQRAYAAVLMQACRHAAIAAGHGCPLTIPPWPGHTGSEQCVLAAPLVSSLVVRHRHVQY
jgi:hypothetical protein